LTIEESILNRYVARRTGIENRIINESTFFNLDSYPAIMSAKIELFSSSIL
jgi:hypothetical protein